LNLIGCAYVNEIIRGRETQRLLINCKSHALTKEYTKALLECEKILSLSPDRYPADEALYSMAVIYADPKNPKRDLRRALDMLKKIKEKFQESKYAYDARVWGDILDSYRKRGISRGDIYLSRAERLFKRGEYTEAIRENKKIINKSTHYRRVQALYNMGLIYADLKNPQKDFTKAIMYFQKVIDEYPESIFALKARIWRDVLISIEKSKQIDIEIEEKKKELTR